MVKIVILLSAMMLVGCCPCRQLATTSQDSVRVEVVERIEWRETVVPLPQEREKVTIRGDSSFLQNSVAASEAIIRPDGSLYHSLFSKPSLNITLPTPRKDSIITRQSYREVVVEVDAPDTRWERMQKNSFWIMLFAIIAYVSWRLRKLFLL